MCLPQSVWHQGFKGPQFKAVLYHTTIMWSCFQHLFSTIWQYAFLVRKDEELQPSVTKSTTTASDTGIWRNAQFKPRHYIVRYCYFDTDARKHTIGTFSSGPGRYTTGPVPPQTAQINKLIHQYRGTNRSFRWFLLDNRNSSALKQ